jgi:hypothetical protein
MFYKRGPVSLLLRRKLSCMVKRSVCRLDLIRVLVIINKVEPNRIWSTAECLHQRVLPIFVDPSYQFELKHDSVGIFSCFPFGHLVAYGIWICVMTCFLETVAGEAMRRLSMKVISSFVVCETATVTLGLNHKSTDRDHMIFSIHII